MAEPEDRNDPEAPPPPPPKRGGRLIPVLVGTNTVALLAIVALQVVMLRGAGGRAASRGEEHPAAPAESREAAPKREAGAKDAREGLPGPTLRLADFVVRLRDPESDRFARLSFELELPDEKAKGEVTSRMAPIRDAFLSYLSDRSAEDLRGSEALARVKGALAQKLSDLAPAASVRGLYLTELVIQ